MAPKQRYGYAVARLRALENRLLDDSVLQRMIEYDTLEAAVKVLSETSYSAWLMELKSPSEYDRAIEAELLHTYTEVENFVPDKELVSLLRMIYDVHNVKTLLKNKFLAADGNSRTDLLTPLGNIDTALLSDLIGSERYWELPCGFDQAIPEALAAWEQNRRVRAVEKIIDGVYFKALLNTAEKLAMSQVTKWVRSRVDGENLRTLLRLSRLKVDRAECLRYLHEGGLIPLDRLLPLVIEPVENWARLLGFAEMGRLLAPFGDGANFNVQLVQYEKNLDNFLTAAISESRYGTFEPANVVRYLWMKEIEAKNLRVVLVSVANGVEKDAIRGVLRDVR